MHCFNVFYYNILMLDSYFYLTMILLFCQEKYM